jgi:hypothetical protein
MSEDKSQARPVNRWNPLGIGPAAAGAMRRAVATRTGAYFPQGERAPEPLLHDSVPAPLDGAHIAAAEILDMIAKANPEGISAQRTDFNSDLLARGLDPADAARFMSGLQRLVTAGLVTRHSASEYSVTDMGALAMLNPAAPVSDGLALGPG